ncbi:hypothetical protein [Actinomadura rubrisoli]|uniref:hypothetical protein n=1 Tax=Actinomadura rubrisoli TaxID=2530368 RepID=UPI0014044BE4|nr:hypothetical protein [Actinomadura rubrisoli]
MAEETLPDRVLSADETAPFEAAAPGPSPGIEEQQVDPGGLDEPVLDPRSAFTTMPLDEAGAQDGPGPVAGTPPLGVEGLGEEAWGGRELVESVYGPLTEEYERLDARLREAPQDIPPVGWAPYIAALRALREGRVVGDWEALARLLVSPGSLGRGSNQIRLVQVRDEAAETRAVLEIVKGLAAAGERALLLAPAQKRAVELLRSVEDDPEIFSLLIETRPSDVGDDGGGAVQPQLREFGSNGTVEFRPLSGPPEPADASSSITRAEPLPVLPEPEEAGRTPEERVRAASVRPVGEAWRQSWRTEARLLQRGLMWLEQWPRDAAALEAVQAENLRCHERLEAERAALAAGIEEARNAAAAAERAAVEVEAEAERLVAVQAEAEAELAGPRAEADRLKAVAAETAAVASERTRTADAAYARCAELDQRAATARSELEAARRLEESLTDELARAREALPAAAEEADRLTAADADAAAEGHAAYYRLVSAESALSALRRKMTLGQRLHVASPPSGLSSLRDEVRARTREADEAAKRAKAAKDAAEGAESQRQGLAAFVSDGGTRLATAQEAQERLGTELTWLATERETASAEHLEQARLAAEAVDRATQASLEARIAHQAAHVIEERLNAARTAREEALATAEQARADADASTARAAAAEAALERHAAESGEELSARDAELETAVEAEARSRENVREICGSDPSGEPELISTHQRRAMARIEQLTAYMEGGEAADAAGDVLLRTADLVIGTPLGAGMAAAEEEFDVLVVTGPLTDAEFLIGAVRARCWILVGEDTTAPADDSVRRGPFERCSVAAPHLLDE